MGTNVQYAYVAFVTLCLSGCVLETYTWDGGNGSAASDAGGLSTSQPIAALRGRVRWPRRAGGSGGSQGPQEGILRVRAIAIDSDAGANGVACPSTIPASAPYAANIAPLADPMDYAFNDIPPGRYCVSVMGDFPPYYGNDETPGCEDPRVPVMEVTVTPPLTALPDVWPQLPVSCP